MSSSDIVPEVALLDHMVVLFLIFGWTSILSPTVAVSVTISPAVHWDSLSSASTRALVISGLFDNSHSNRCQAVSQCGSDLRFPYD